jgi:hypothetical protein
MATAVSSSLEKCYEQVITISKEWLWCPEVLFQLSFWGWNPVASMRLPSVPS